MTRNESDYGKVTLTCAGSMANHRRGGRAGTVGGGGELVSIHYKNCFFVIYKKSANEIIYNELLSMSLWTCRIDK